VWRVKTNGSGGIERRGEGGGAGGGVVARGGDKQVGEEGRKEDVGRNDKRGGLERQMGTG